MIIFKSKYRIADTDWLMSKLVKIRSFWYYTIFFYNTIYSFYWAYLGEFSESLVDNALWDRIQCASCIQTYKNLNIKKDKSFLHYYEFLWKIGKLELFIRNMICGICISAGDAMLTYRQSSASLSFNTDIWSHLLFFRHISDNNNCNIQFQTLIDEWE